jgi:hypothetical protein
LTLENNLLSSEADHTSVRIRDFGDSAVFVFLFWWWEVVSLLPQNSNYPPPDSNLAKIGLF